VQLYLFYLIWLLAAYVLGSVSSGALVAKLAGLEIGNLGDGNPGARNVWRQIGHKRGLAVFVADFATGAVVTLPLYFLGTPIWMRTLAMVAVLAGHFFPVFWKFRGGTGGAVGMGTTLGLLPLGVLIAVPVTTGVFVLTRTSIYTMWAFFGVTLLAGSLLHRDPPAFLAVVLAAMAPVFKWAAHHRIRSVTDVRKWLNR